MANQRLRIFVSSPGDVVEERLISQRVIRRVEGRFAGFFKLEPILWEWEPVLATDDPQSQLILPSSTDIVICILWSRLGTPLGDKFTRADGTRYNSGTEFEFEDAANAWRQHGRPDLLVYRKTEEPTASLRDPAAFAQRMEQSKRLDAFVTKWCRDDDGTFTAIFHAVTDTEEFEHRLERHLTALLRDRLPDSAEAGTAEHEITWTAGSPYRGLEPFHEEHRDVFFGRTKAVSDVKARLLARSFTGVPFLLILGASGSGKSSLMRAGVIPLIRQPGVIEGCAYWAHTVCRPGDNANGPLSSLCDALLRALPTLADVGYDTEASLAEILGTHPEHFAKPIAAAIKLSGEKADSPPSESRPDQRLLLGIDQLEELFTVAGPDHPQREPFSRAVEALVRSGHVWVVATMRSDFYPSIQQDPILSTLKGSDGQLDLAAPSTAEIGRIITQPAAAAGLRFETRPDTGESLDERLRDAAVQAAHGLPLLEFTLDELYRRRDDQRTLTFEAYEALGGLGGAIAKRAEEAYQSLPLESQMRLPNLLRALVTAQHQADERATARRITIKSVIHDIVDQDLINAYTQARLLVTDRDDSARPTLALAHEALLRNWKRARTIVEDDLAFLKARDRLDNAARLWSEAGKPRDYLLPPGRPLEEAQALLNERAVELRPSTRELIAASRSSARRGRRLRRTVVVSVLVGFFVMVTAFGAVSYSQLQYARSQRDEAVKQGDAAEFARGLADKQFQQTLLRQQEANRNFEYTLQTADELAVSVAHDLRYEDSVPTEMKIRLAHQFDENFQTLLTKTDDNRDIRALYAELLIANAQMLFEVGRYPEAVGYARRGHLLVHPIDGSRGVALDPVARAEASLAMAHAHTIAGDYGAAHAELDRAEGCVVQAGGADLPLGQQARLQAEIALQRSGLYFDMLRPDETLAVLNPAIRSIDVQLAELHQAGMDDSIIRGAADLKLALQCRRVLTVTRFEISETEVLDESFVLALIAARDHGLFFKPHGNDMFACDLNILRATQYGSNPVLDATLDRGISVVGAPHVSSRRTLDAAIGQVTEAIKIAYAAHLRDPGNLRIREALAKSLLMRAQLSIGVPDVRLATQDIRQAEQLYTANYRAWGPYWTASDLDLWHAQMQIESGLDDKLKRMMVTEPATFVRAATGLELFYNESIEGDGPGDRSDERFTQVPHPRRWCMLKKLTIWHVFRLQQNNQNSNAVMFGEGWLSMFDLLTESGCDPTALVDTHMQVFRYMVNATTGMGDPETQQRILLAWRQFASETVSQYGTAHPLEYVAFYLYSTRAFLDLEQAAEALAEINVAREILNSVYGSPQDDGTILEWILGVERQSMEVYMAQGRLDLMEDVVSELVAIIESSDIAFDEIETIQSKWAVVSTYLDGLPEVAVDPDDDAYIVSMQHLATHTTEWLHAKSVSLARVARAVASAGPLRVELREWSLRSNRGETINLAEGAARTYVPTSPFAWTDRPWFEAGWRTLTGPELDSTIRQLMAATEIPVIHRVRVCQPAFYDDVGLYECEYSDINGLGRTHIALRHGDEWTHLVGNAPPIYEMNSIAGLNLENADEVASYLKFFSCYLAGEDGAWRIIEYADNLRWHDSVSLETRLRIAAIIRPLVVWPHDELEGHWQAAACVNYSNHLYYVHYTVSPTGSVEMTDDVPVASEIPIWPSLLFYRGYARQGTQALDLSAIAVE